MRTCSVCGVEDDRALFRTSPFGESFDGAHEDCQEMNVDPEVKAICDTIEERILPH